MNQQKKRLRYEKLLGSAIDNACQNLPDGYEIEISLERGSGVVTLFDGDGDAQEYPGNHEEGIGGDINDALEYAIAIESTLFSNDETSVDEQENERADPLRFIEDRPDTTNEIVFRPQWPDGITAREQYEIPCDDDGRRCDSRLSVMVDDQGDCYVSAHAYHDANRNVRNLNPFPTIRIRTHIGGGQNMRTRQALLWLAQAIRLDNIDNPQNLKR